MNRIIIDPMGAAEKRKVGFDFAAEVPVGVTILSAVAGSSLYSGTDDSSEIVNGSPSVTGTIVTVTLGGTDREPTVGCIYDVVTTATLSDGQIIPMAAYVACVPSLL